MSGSDQKRKHQASHSTGSTTDRPPKVLRESSSSGPGQSASAAVVAQPTTSSSNPSGSPYAPSDGSTASASEWKRQLERLPLFSSRPNWVWVCTTGLDTRDDRTCLNLVLTASAGWSGSPDDAQILAVMRHAVQYGNPFCRSLADAQLVDIYNRDKGLARAINSLPSATLLDILRIVAYFSNAEPAAVPPNRLKSRPEPTTPDVLEAAWSEPFSGQPDTVFLRSVLIAYGIVVGSASPKDYSNTISIVQSSGMGKSRMVHEAGKFIFTIPLNLRPDSEELAYPLPDRQVRDYMLGTLLFDEVVDSYRNFLCHLFFYIRHWLCSQTPRFESYTEAVQAWNMFVQKERISIYNSIIDVVKRSPAVTSKSTLCEQLQDLHDILLSFFAMDPKVEANSAFSPHVPAVFNNVLDTNSRVKCRDLANEALKRFGDLSEYDPPVKTAKAGKEQVKVANLRILIYFDEAHVLTGEVLQNSQKTRYNALLSVLNDLIKMPIFGIFLSTSSHIAQLAPPAKLATSTREAKSKELQAPFTEVSFDCSPDLPVELSRLTVAQVCSVKFMANFGRPLFWTMLKHGENIGTIEDNVLELACSKLKGTDSDLWRVCPREGQIAVLDVRLCFDYETRSAITEGFEADLVASHMRIAYSVPKHRLFIRSGYSSEPVLGEAAAKVWNIWTNAATQENQPAWDPLNLLSEICKSGLIRKGERGELVARTLFVLAYDRAMRAKHLAIYSNGCSIVELVSALFQKEPAAKILKCGPDNVGNNITFKEAFKNSHTRFTQFVVLGDSSGLTPEAMCAAYVRGVAFICHATQERVDFLWVFLLDKAKNVGVDNISALLVQVKNRGKAGAQGLYDFTAEQLNMFGIATAARQRPYCTILMELGVKAKKGMPSKSEKKQGPKTTRTGQSSMMTALTMPPESPSKLVVPQAVRKSPRNPPVHPRYNIRVYGCSSTLYAVIKDNEKDVYSNLLQEHNAVADHPRPENASAVWNMKPVWVRRKDVDSYDWVKSEPLAHGPVADDPADNDDLVDEDLVDVASVYDDSQDSDAE